MRLIQEESLAAPKLTSGLVLAAAVVVVVVEKKSQAAALA